MRDVVIKVDADAYAALANRMIQTIVIYSPDQFRRGDIVTVTNESDDASPYLRASIWEVDTLEATNGSGRYRLSIGVSLSVMPTIPT